MNIQELDDECLKAVVVRIPVKDVIQNVKPLSRRFRDATEFSLKQLTEREPISLVVCGGCKHSYYTSNKPPKVTLAGILVSMPALSELANCSLLPLVSSASLCDPFCNVVPMDFKLPLRAILLKLTCATSLKLPLKASEHYDCLELKCRHDDRYPFSCQRPFLGIAFNAADLLSQLRSLEFTSTYRGDGLCFSLENRNDFAQFVTFVKRLEKLVVPIGLFEFAAKSDNLALQQLASLGLFANEYNDETTCRAMLEKISVACPELSDLRYDCIHPDSEFGHCCHKDCVGELGVLQQLNNLRSLTLNFGGCGNICETQTARLSSLEFLSLTLPGDNEDKVLHLLWLLSVSPNLKTLELSPQADYYGMRFLDDHPRKDRLPMSRIISRLKSLLVAGALSRLETLLIDASESSLCIYEQIHKLSAIPGPVSLRTIKILDSDSSCIVRVPPALSSFERAGPETGITYAIANAKNITVLRFPMAWLDSYKQLEQLVLAMQHGSLKRLFISSSWYRNRSQFGMDKRAVSAVLPAGCRIVGWNVNSENGKTRLSSIVIVGHKLGPRSTASSKQSDEIKFWVTFEADAESEPRAY